MRRYLVARLAQAFIVVVLSASVTFLLIHLAPGDPLSYGAETISPDIRAHWRAQFGYDRPVSEQFVRYLTSLAHGQLGYSHSLHVPVAMVLRAAVPRTLLLIGVALALSMAIGVVLGVAQAARRDSLFDRTTTAVLLAFYSLPDFWLALLLLLVFAYWVPVLPAGGMVDPVMHEYMGFWARAGDRVAHLILPAGTLVLLSTAAIARYQRAAVLEVLPLEFVRTARAKGVSEGWVLAKHVLRNALLPLITLIGLSLPALVGGSLFVEKIFGWPGMGYTIATAIAARDYDLVTAGVVIGGVMVALGSLVADVLYTVADPRVRR